MPLSYSTISYPDCAKGIDSVSAPNLIQDGYSKDLVNVNTKVEGHLEKRKGYQGYYGYIPFRVMSVEYTSDPTNNIIFTLDTSLDFSTVDSSPIMVYGKLSDTTMDGDFLSSADATVYYSAFDVSQPITFPASTSTTESLDVGIESDAIAVGVAEATSSDKTNTFFFPDDITVNATTYAVGVTINNTGLTDLDVFVYYKDKTTVSGTVSQHTLSGVTSSTVSAATHNLDHYQIIPLFESLSAGVYTQFIPDSFTINQSTGSVISTFSSAITGRLTLTAAPITNRVTGTAVAGTTKTVTISNPGSPFNFVACYLEPTPGDPFELVIPNSISYDETTDVLTIEFINSGLTDATFEVYWENAEIRQNKIKVTGTVSVTGTDTAPQLVIWGISHEGLYSATSTAGGYATHIDSYQTSTESRLVCGLGGNLFTATTASEIGSTYAPLYYVNLRNRINSAATTIAPVFQTTGAGVARTRGSVEGDEIASNLAPVTAVAYNAGTGYVDYTITLTNKATLDSTGTADIISNVISTTSDLEDWLTVSNMNHSRLEGTFKIMGVDETPSTVIISVENSDIDSSDYDDANAEGLAGVFTDIITVSSTNTFVADDVLASELFNSADTPAVLSTSGTSCVIDDINHTSYLTAGVRLFATRNSAVIPLRNELSTATVTNLVKGDMLTFSNLGRQPRIIDIDLTNNTITVDESLEIYDDTGSSISITPVGRWYPVEIPESTGDLLPTTQVTHFDCSAYNNQSIVRSTVIKDTMFFTNGQDEVLKFDGTNIYRAGLPKWKPLLFSSIDNTGSDSLTLPGLIGTVSGVAGDVFTVGAGESYLFTVGQKIVHTNNDAIYTILGIDLTNEQITVNKAITGGAADDIQPIAAYRYYFKIYAIDANDNIVASAVTSSEDCRLELTEAAVIKHRIVGLPDWDIYDYDRLEVHTYRTKRNLETPFYLVNILKLSFDDYTGYLDITDAIIDDALTNSDLDPESSVLLGNEIASTWSEPIRAKYITSSDNRLLLANVKEYPKFDIVLRQLRTDSLLDTTDLLQAHQVRWLFRKDNTDTATTTNMVDRVAFEFVPNTSAVTIVPNTDITKTTSSFTVTTAGAHGLVAGDWIYMYHNAAALTNLKTYAGWWQIASVTVTGVGGAAAHTFTINSTLNTAAGATDVDRYITATAPEDVPVLLAADYNYSQKDHNPSSTPYQSQAMLRLSNAINAVMRVADRAISGQETFRPWLIANSGRELGSGRLIVSQPKVFDTTAELVLDSAHGTSYQVFVNELRRTSSEQISTYTKLYPSRVWVSYKNYPEIFDEQTLFADVNTADGQEITGIIPFFSESAFGQATLEEVVVTFKEKSIYLLNTSTLAVQKIDSRGLGCTYPYSITPTKAGIMFANRTGIYRLNHDLTISYVGRMMEGFWKQSIEKDLTTVLTGHHHALEQRYELSVPFTGDSSNDDVFVYDYSREGVGQEFGAWTRYTNFPACGWANLANDAFFASTKGEVFSIRRTGNTSDFRDDGAACAEMDIILKPFSFGASGVRHKIRDIITNFEVDGTMTGTTLAVSIDLSTTYTTASTFNLTSGTASAFTGREVVSLKSSPPYTKCIYISPRYRNSTKDEDVIIAGVSFTVAALNNKNIQQSQSGSSITI